MIPDFANISSKLTKLTFLQWNHNIIATVLCKGWFYMKKISLLSFMLLLFTIITIANTAGNFYWYRSSGEDGNALVVNAFPSTDREVFESVLEFPNIGTNDPSFQNR